MPDAFAMPKALAAQKALCEALERATRIAAPSNIVRTTGCVVIPKAIIRLFNNVSYNSGLIP